MSCAYPALGQAAVTAAAMRAAADLIETSGTTGLSVTCGDDQVSIQVTGRAGDGAARAQVVARLAALLGGTAVQDDDPRQSLSWITAHGVLGAVPAKVFTAVTVACADGPGLDQRLPLAVSPDGRTAAASAAARLPAGWRWATELDHRPGQEVA